MAGSKRVMIIGAMVAAVAATAFSAPADARRYHRRKVVLVGATLRPGYVGAPGYVGGPPGPVVPALIDYPAPMGPLTGVPVLTALGF